MLERPGVRKVAGNTFWLLADRVVRLGVGLLVGVWVARYLGPERFGQFSYVVAFVTLLGTAVAAGTDGVVIGISPGSRGEPTPSSQPLPSSASSASPSSSPPWPPPRS